jgi:hypothetical protein
VLIAIDIHPPLAADAAAEARTERLQDCFDDTRVHETSGSIPE